MDSQKQYDALYNEMKNLLSEEIPDHDKVNKCAENFIKIKRSFPPDLRFRIWEVLLDVSECEEIEFDSIINNEIPFDSRDFNQDVDRSFFAVEKDRRNELKEQLRKIIPAYCVKYEVKYWQGMCDIVESILRIEPQPPLHRIFMLLSVFLQTFMANPINRDCILFTHVTELLRLLLQYHDPELYCHLRANNITLDIFAMSLFLAIFAHDVCHPLLLSIWDQYFVYRNPVIHIFTILSHLIHNRSLILVKEKDEKDNHSDLLVNIKHLPFDNDDPRLYKRLRVEEEPVEPSPCEKVPMKNDPSILTNLVSDGLELMKKTPPGFLHCINNIIFEKMGITVDTLESYKRMSCIQSSPAEIITSLTSKVESNRHCLNYLYLDTRPYEEYKRGHLIDSRNVTLKTLKDQERMQFLVQKIKSLHRHTHVVILSNARENEEDLVCAHLVNVLIQSGCLHISKVIGGYNRICELMKQHAIKLDLFLIRENNTESEEEAWEKERASEKNNNMKKIDGKVWLKYGKWLNNPRVVCFSCKRIHIFNNNGKKEFKCSKEKKMLLCDENFFIIDIENCPDSEYAFIDFLYKYKSITEVTPSNKNFMCFHIMVNNEIRQLWYCVEKRDECIKELKSRIL